MDHNIPNMPNSRLYHVSGVVGSWLWVCSGESRYDCKKVDLNAEYPVWVDGVSVPWRGRHATMYAYDDYLYFLGGYDQVSLKIWQSAILYNIYMCRYVYIMLA